MIGISGSHFVDEHGRRLILRGVNLSGSSKVPRTPDGATHIREGFFDHRGVSFVGRPFPLAEADEHFARLKMWGLTFLRLLVTWEAIEHAGPGIYDEDYLEYIRRIVEKAARHGFHLFIDPHQDVWSRFSGGDGAPGWTFEAVGMDIVNFQATGAALVHQMLEGPLPRMIWPTNSIKLAAATMFTLFFGGNDFAPATRVEGEPVQEYLQRHYIAAVCKLAERLKGIPCVVGYDTLNEPLQGFIGVRDVRVPELWLMKKGLTPSAYQAMLLGAGFPQRVEEWDLGLTGFRLVGSRMVNETRARAWLPGRECLWRESGVWDLGPGGQPRLLRPDHFARKDGRPVDFPQDYLLPFVRSFTAAVRSADPRAAIFIESLPESVAPRLTGSHIVYAPHKYDDFVLTMKRYSDWIAIDSDARSIMFTPWRIRRVFRDRLLRFRREAAERLGNAPVLIGEFGIPMDLQEKRAYRTGDFRAEIKALDRTFRAFEDTLLSGTLWNYTPDNTNRRGDQWNEEDLSLFSRDQQTDPRDIHSGGRALEAAVRPYARAVAGDPLRMRFDIRRREFTLEFRHDANISAPTELFIPDYQYPCGYTVTLSDGSYEANREEQTLIYRHTKGREIHEITVRPATGN